MATSFEREANAILDEGEDLLNRSFAIRDGANMRLHLDEIVAWVRDAQKLAKKLDIALPSPEEALALSPRYEGRAETFIKRVLRRFGRTWTYQDPSKSLLDSSKSASADERKDADPFDISKDNHTDEIGRTKIKPPRAFVSYSWDDDLHKDWVAELAAELRADGVETILDQWHAVPGDQLPEFMEREIRENDYVLIICTPNYRLRSDERKGGVGYEGDIMTAEVLTSGNHRKFIPILARSSWDESAPSWLKGKYYIDLSSPENRRKYYSDLTTTLLGTRPVAPPVSKSSRVDERREDYASGSDEPVKIVGVIVDEVTEPALDGTQGSALYTVPFRLS